MAMTKKDFIILADQLKEAKPNPRDILTEDLLGTRILTPGVYAICMATWKITVQHVVMACDTINPRFDSEIFKKACGYYD